MFVIKRILKQKKRSVNKMIKNKTFFVYIKTFFLNRFLILQKEYKQKLSKSSFIIIKLSNYKSFNIIEIL